jgi:diamine N-acetyltransferase
MRFTIRAANAVDAQALADFGRATFFETFGHLYPPEDAQTFSSQRFTLARSLADLCEEGRQIHLAFEGDNLVGFLDCGELGLPVSQQKANARELYRLYLDPSVKGTGLAQTLMGMAIEWAKAQGSKALYLGVYCDNARAQAFYRKYGFEIIGAYQFKVGNTLDDERIMELELKDDV